MNELTLTEAGALIGRSSSTLRHQVQFGKLKARKVGNTYVITERELLRYATETRRPALVAELHEREDPR